MKKLIVVVSEIGNLFVFIDLIIFLVLFFFVRRIGVVIGF